MQNIVSLSDKARSRLAEISAHKNSSHIYLTINGGGCAGVEYGIEFKPELEANDIPFYSDKSLSIYGNKVVVKYANDLTIDFMDEIVGRKFIFKNPRSSGNCSCGKSMSF